LIGGKPQVLADFNNFLATCQVVGSSQVAVKILIEGEIGGKFALASGEEANIREKDREVYCPPDY